MNQVGERSLSPDSILQINIKSYMKKIEVLNKENSDMTSDFHNYISNMYSENLTEEELTAKGIRTDELYSVSGNLVAHDLFNNEHWLLNEEFPIGSFPVRFDDEYKFALIKLKDKADVVKWKKAKLSRIFYAFNQCPEALTTEVKKHSRIIDAPCINLCDVETLLIQRLRAQFNIYAEPGRYKYDDEKMKLTEEAENLTYCDVAHICFKSKEGVFFPFTGYDSEDNVACLLFHFKSNSEVMEGKK